MFGGGARDPRKDKEVLQPKFSSSQSIPDPPDTGWKDPDQMISMRKEDFEKLVMERSHQLMKERDREKGLPDPGPMTGLAKDNDGYKRLSKRGIPGGLEQEDEAESRTPPPRPRSPEKVGLGVEGYIQHFRAQGEPVHKQDPTMRSRSRSQERNRQVGRLPNGAGGRIPRGPAGPE
ncbi:hypothetical protein DH2020_016624 [Rehmannia glutinosa]|uniref:Uncharacterized protein n=1 Tax=Rehmannia glutinosa TaxID=99300 RepID=A0ABR0WS35_REHGL